MYTKSQILNYLREVTDPEVPVLSILDLGVVREVVVEQDAVNIIITPTYSGCPAMHTIAHNIKFELISRGIKSVQVTEVLEPAWTTDWMTQEGKQKLEEYGIAPPQYLKKDNEYNDKVVVCPRCKSVDTECISIFGSTACKSLYKCKACLEPFDYFKCH